MSLNLNVHDNLVIPRLTASGSGRTGIIRLNGQRRSQRRREDETGD
jgi:hypothetical protein